MNGNAVWTMRGWFREIGATVALLFLLAPATAPAQTLPDALTATAAAIERLRFAQESFPAAAEDLETVVTRLERSRVGTDGVPLAADSCHLRPAPEGLTAWIEARQAVLQIEALLDQAARNNPRLPLAPALASLLAEVRDSLLGAYGFLADVALQEACGFAGDASSSAQVAVAERQLAQARAEIAAGDPVQAMQSLRQAWEHAGQVIPEDTAGADRPRLSIQQPLDGAVLFASPVDVAGMVQLLTAGTVGAEDVEVAVNGVPAEVVQRSFVARGVALAEGLNALVGVAQSADGGTATACVAVVLDTAPRARVAAVSGTGQTGEIRTALPDPLEVQVTDAAGGPVAGAQVIFRVVTGDGSLDGGLRSALVPADGQGRSAIGFTLGSRAGVAVNRVRVSAVVVPGEVIFAPTATTTAAASINAVSGDNQRGAVGEPLALPLVVVVTDAGQNPVEGAPVIFEVLAGGGTVAGGAAAVVPTDGDGRAAAELTLGPDTGLDNQLVRASFAGLANEPATFKASAFVTGDPAATALAGVVLDNQGAPVPGVTLRIAGTPLGAAAGADGQFLLEGVPVGEVVLEADASTAARPGVWASLSFDLHTLPGIVNTLEKPIYILPLDVGNGRIAGGAEDVTIEVPEVPGFSLTVLAGSATFPDGSPTGLVSVTPVHADKIPMAPGSGMQPRFIVTVQPAGAHFDPPAPVTFPNVDGLAPGSVTEMFSFDHDLGEFVSIGTGTVSEDGTVVASDPGFGIVKAGWHCSAPQSGSGAGSSLQVEVTNPDPITLVKDETETITANGRPPRDSEYRWETSDASIVSLTPSGGGLCPDSTTCSTVATAKSSGTTTVTVTFTCTTTGKSVQDTVSVEVVEPEIKLEKVGMTVIEAANNYSENTTLRATAVFPSGHPRAGETVTSFDEPITFEEEAATSYYDGANGGTKLPKDVVAVAGVAEITLKSVSNSNNAAGPPDAQVKATAPGATEQAATNPLSVDQWVDEDSNSFIDWLDLFSSDRLAHFQGVSGLSGTVAGLVTGIVQVSGGCGATTIDTTIIGVSPVCGSPNRHRLDTRRELSDTVIHESRHVWQHAQERVSLGTGAAPTNDSDRDHCPEAVPAGSEAGAGDATPIIDGTPPSSGDGSADLPYPSFCRGIFETDAAAFAAAHNAD